ncbi:MAG: AMP nucleosidase [Chlamydiae bacterium]|nr:AMP nucleosidase [Chlamydiota bacterium]
MKKKREVSDKEIQVAKDALERYSGSPAEDYCDYVLLTNFPKYVDYFSKTKKVDMHEGSMFTAAHCKKTNISILDFKIGSPSAALVVDLCSYLPIKACLLLGMCGGLRRRYKKGEYLIPIAAIRGEGTSDYYFPIEVPALSNFLVQRAVSEVLDEEKATYHVGITHTTNKRFWEFDEHFKDRLKANRSQAIEMECATLFAGSYRRKLPLGALLLISDLPLNEEDIKTKASSEEVFEKFTEDHVEKGIRIIHQLKKLQENRSRGAYRPDVSKIETEDPTK